MPTLLSPQPTFFSIQKKSLAVGNDSANESFDCSSPTKKTFSPSFTRSLLSLIVIIGLLHQTTLHYSTTGSPTLVSRAYDAYGQLTSETTSLNGSPLSSWTQTWDGAGNRAQLLVGALINKGQNIIFPTMLLEK